MNDPVTPPPPADDAGRKLSQPKERRPKAKPPRFAPDPNVPVEPGYECNARTRAPDHHLCDNRAGLGTVHPGAGRCRRHGGATPIRHGRYSAIRHETLGPLIAKHEADPSPLDILPELAAMRALFEDFITRYDSYRVAILAWYEDSIHGGSPEKPRQLLDIADAYRLLAETTKIVERIERIRAANAVSRPDLLRILSEMANVVTMHVADEATRQRIKDGWASIRL